ncbi:MAG: type VI secretion system lipoprotein TssJ [Gammaproteobacteria bacterium]
MRIANRWGFFKGLMVLGCILNGVACSGVPNPKDVAVDLFKENPPTLLGAIVAGPELNVRTDGVATSAVVRIYELGDPSEFNQLDFFAVVQSPKTVLGDDLLNIKEFVVLPGSTVILDSRELAKGTSHIGVVADFRDWQGAQWRALMPLEQDNKTYIGISVDKNVLSVTEESRKWLRKLQK